MEVMEPEDAIVAVEEYVHEPGFGGYDFVFVDELSLGQTCSICLVAMRNPVQTMCGHRFCEDCLLGTFRQANDQRICPQDRNPIPEDGGFFRDVAWEREILSLRVQCKKSERGCDWIGQLRHYEGHLNVCHYEDVVCDDCDGEMQRRFLEEHMTSECRNRIVQCEHCEEEFAFWRTEVHEDEECARFPLECPQQCGVQEIPREEVESHVSDACLMTIVACPYEGAGCNFHDKRVKLEAHMDKSSEDHLRKTWSELLKAKQKLSDLEKITVQVGTLQKEKESIKSSSEKNSEEINDLKLSEKKLEVENMMLRKDVTELGKQLEKLRLTASNEKKESRLLQQQVQTFQTQNTTLKRELTELGKELRKLTAANQKKEKTLLNKDLSYPKTGVKADEWPFLLPAVRDTDWGSTPAVVSESWGSTSVEIHDPEDWKSEDSECAAVHEWGSLGWGSTSVVVRDTWGSMPVEIHADAGQSKYLGTDNVEREDSELSIKIGCGPLDEEEKHKESLPTSEEEEKLSNLGWNVLQRRRRRKRR